MREYSFEITGIPLSVTTKYEYPSLERFKTDKEGYSVDISSKRMNYAHAAYGNELNDEEMEYTDIIVCSGLELLKHKRCIFHGVAFRWKNRAWILTAPSGTGKTTQYVLWKMINKDEVTIINGDKPVLDFSSDSIIVSTSPWRGKENMSNMISAPLGGIVVLKQSESNSIGRLSNEEAAADIYRQILYYPDCNESVDLACKTVEKILESIPVWRLENVADSESVFMTMSEFQYAMEE